MKITQLSQRFMNSSRSIAHRGFTLMELLVVIAIVTVLASLIFAFAANAKKKANSVATLNSLRQIGTGAIGWMSENNNFYPPCWDNTNGGNRSYIQILGEYMYDNPNYRDAEGIFVGPNARLPVKVGPHGHPSTFSMNRAVCADITVAQGANTKPKLIHSSQVERTTDVILMADGCQKPPNNTCNTSAYRITQAVKNTGPVAKYDEAIPVGPDVDTSAGDGWFRYPDGKCNALMCDGSVRTFDKGTIKNRNIWIDSVRD